MSSILTNNSAMVALQTLKSVNSNLQKVQGEISTGKSIASARDNSAVWSISKVMESDVKGFKAISESLSLGESTVSVARSASETVTDLLTEIKGKIVAAQEQNVDRDKIQTDIKALRDQINSVVSAAQFNGLNLVKGPDDVNILSSLDRTGTSTVNASNITISRQDLGTGAGTNGVGSGGTDLSGQILDAAGGSTYAGGTLSATGNTAVIEFAQTTGWDANDSTTISVAGLSVGYTSAAADQTETNVRDALLSSLQALDLDGVSFSSNSTNQIVVTSTRPFEALDIAITDSVSGGDGNTYIQAINGATTGNTTTETGSIDQRAEEIFFTAGASVAEGNSYQASIGGTAYFYTAGKGETFEDVARGLKTAIDSAGIDGISTQVAIDSATGQASLKIDNSGSDLSLATAAMDGGTASGGLFGLDSIDVTSNAGADAALDNIETMIQTSIDAAASFGSAQGRIETQSDFVGKLIDSLKSGIGTLVDADMEEASARLQALQVQQQLATQSLSIANQAPQSILSLFR
ncbi:MAG: flagellin [Roseicyclus sp.]|nr:flagellin [Roseicyclus sp.]MBO6625065.1 flagellin [Roseicyclus sp.]MBO6923544.1 flagellin [Roseicyclus sp.]